MQNWTLLWKARNVPGPKPKKKQVVVCASQARLDEAKAKQRKAQDGATDAEARVQQARASGGRSDEREDDTQCAPDDLAELVAMSEQAEKLATDSEPDKLREQMAKLRDRLRQSARQRSSHQPAVGQRVHQPSGRRGRGLHRRSHHGGYRSVRRVEEAGWRARATATIAFESSWSSASAGVEAKTNPR